MKKILNKSLTRIGRKFFTKRSDFFERFEKLKQEREQTKEKYINENEFYLNETEEENEEITKFKQELKEEVYSETEYLNTYKQNQNKENKKRVDQFFENEKTLKEKISEYLGKSQNSQTEFLKKSQKLINSKKDFPTFLKSINEETDYLDDYDRYDYYKENYIEQESNSKMKKRDENKFIRRNEEEFLHSGLNNFYKELDPKISKNEPIKTANSVNAKMLYQSKKEKWQDKNILKTDPYHDINLQDQEEDYDPEWNLEMPDSKEPLEDDVQTWSFHNRLKKQAEKAKNPESLSEKNYEEDYLSQLEINAEQEQIIAEENENTPQQKEFSLRAQFQIYLFYLQGWKIKDLSFRFGATPIVIKCAIWNLQYFFEDILPELSIGEACYLLSLEENRVDQINRVDYGVDLDELMDMEVGFISMMYPRKTLDHIPKLKQERFAAKEEIDRVVERFKKKKEDFVTEGFETKGVQGYLIQNWVVHRGKGAIKVNRTFREIVQRSHYKGYQKKNVESRLHQGPRIAAQGFGYK